MINKPLVKAGMLLVLLAIPVFIFLFLKAFGNNSYTLPVYYEEGVDSSLETCNFSKGQHYIPEFSFTSQDGRTINDQVLNDKVTVVEFFFTSCPNICPVMSKELLRVQDKFEDQEGVQILSFTVDPEHDTQKVLKEYSERYEVQNESWNFLTGDKTEIYRVARCGFVLPVEDGNGSPEDFIHSEKFILVDGQKRIRGYYDGTDREDVDRLMMEIDILLKN